MEERSRYIISSFPLRLVQYFQAMPTLGLCNPQAAPQAPTTARSGHTPIVITRIARYREGEVVTYSYHPLPFRESVKLENVSALKIACHGHHNVLLWGFAGSFVRGSCSKNVSSLEENIWTMSRNLYFCLAPLLFVMTWTKEISFSTCRYQKNLDTKILANKKSSLGVLWL